MGIGKSVGSTFTSNSKFEFLQDSELEHFCDARVKAAWEISDLGKRKNSLEKWIVYGPMGLGFALHIITLEWSQGVFGFFSILAVAVLGVWEYSSSKRNLNHLCELAYQEAKKEFNARRAATKEDAEKLIRRTAAANANLRAARNRLRASPPPPMPRGVNARAAEELCAQWMRFLGANNVKVTKYSSDGGIDVEAMGYIAQVKNYTGTVGVAAIREFSGVAMVDGRFGLFFTSGSYAAGGIDFADKADIALFRYSAEEGELFAVNAWAEVKLERGLI